jgi:hypothetical protein
LKFFKKIAKMLLKDEEIAKLKAKSSYEDDDWMVPPFVLRQKEISLPKVNARGVMEQEKEERNMEIADVGSTSDSEQSDKTLKS